MNKNKLHGIKEYIGTAIVTVIVVFLLCLCVELDLLFHCERTVNTRELNIANLLEFCKIEQLERRLRKEPKNYVVAIKLAQHYEKLGEYSKANNLFSDAVKISNNSNYSVYSYAMFCARRSLYGLASGFAENISSSTKKAYEYKAQIFEQIALSLDKNKQYEAEVKAYQIAQKYAKNVKDVDYLEKINLEYANSFVKLADYHIDNNDPDSAILDLKNSLKIKVLDLAKYKLALILINTDRVSAEKNFYEVLNSDPFMINPYIYAKLLDDLIKASANDELTHSADYYTMHLNKLKRIMQDNYVYRDEIIIDKSHIVEFKKFFNKNKKYYLYFDLKNNTKYKLARLYVKTDIFVNNKQYSVQKRVINSANSLGYYGIAEELKLLLPDDFSVSDLKKNHDVIVKYFAKKSVKAPWTLVKIESLNF